jgi:hypothetical protein
MLDTLKNQIIYRKNFNLPNIYDIKAPVGWLQRMELEYCISREDFKEFLYAYDLLNIPYIIEAIKKVGGIDYKGARSYTIAHKKSKEQEKWWGDILKEKYGEDIGVQFQYENCFFDFIHINKNTIYECKLGLKDFNEEQHSKYLLALNKYTILYLIDRDCVINIAHRMLYTTDTTNKYIIQKLKSPFDEIRNCNVNIVDDLRNFI